MANFPEAYYEVPCFTGDCPHNNQSECLLELTKTITELRAELAEAQRKLSSAGITELVSENERMEAQLERVREQLNLLAEETERRPSGAMWAIAQDLRRIAEGGE